MTYIYKDLDLALDRVMEKEKGNGKENDDEVQGTENYGNRIR